MLSLDSIQPGARIRGLAGQDVVSVAGVRRYGPDTLAITYRMPSGDVGEQLVYQAGAAVLELVDEDPARLYDGDAARFRLASEACRIHLAHVFDPYLAVHASQVDVLPHQIAAVYEEMLPRLPLRYVLADDLGAGKTITTGLFIKELLMRGALSRCLIVPPGSLTEQWRDEMMAKFGLRFRILTGEPFNRPDAVGNPFLSTDLCIMSLDRVARNERVQAKLRETAWDLIVCDEAHKMSATVSGGQVKRTKRFQAGQLLSSVSTHFLLLTATPHNGKEKDFRLFLSLVDPDQFVASAHSSYPVRPEDVEGVMRRMVKEDLVRQDGTPLFPERRAYSVQYSLSGAEAELYEAVTQYVQGEFNRAERLESGRKNVVGFALTVLQRRLASSPEAICQSLRRRRERLAERRSARSRFVEDYDNIDFRSIDPDGEEDTFVYRATAARTRAELDAEIATLERLGRMAEKVREGGEDRKWQELRALLLRNPHMFRPNGTREKLIIFSEHRDTLAYLRAKIEPTLRPGEKLVMIHGGMPADARRREENRFRQDPFVSILLATDAAGEGVNLQAAHLMVNYDLPWNPNRLEQRFGRIHRIGQTEVCHLWNLVSAETREGMVYARLLSKIEAEGRALNGRVFNVLGRLSFKRQSLSELLTEAVRYNDREDVRRRLFAAVDKALDHGAIQKLLDEQALAADVLDPGQVMAVREEMERSRAHSLQPHAIESFFVAAFNSLGGRIREQGPGRYQVTRVPPDVRKRGSSGFGVKAAYDRICFDKALRMVPGEAGAELITPGHPLLDATLELVLEGAEDLLGAGTVLVDDMDAGIRPRLLFFAESSLRDGVILGDGAGRTVSKSLHFVEMLPDGTAQDAGYAPYLACRAPTTEELPALREYVAGQPWLSGWDSKAAAEYTIQNIVPKELAAVRGRTARRVDKTAAAVRERLRAEAEFWRDRADALRASENEQEKKGFSKSSAADRQAKELDRRVESRLALLEQEKRISALPPRIVSCAVVIPRGLADRLMGRPAQMGAYAPLLHRLERIAMSTVLAIERSYGHCPMDARAERPGYWVESRVPEGRRDASGNMLRFIDIKPYAPGTTSVRISRSEILAALNAPDQFILALVEVRGCAGSAVYLERPFTEQPPFDVATDTISIPKLVRGAGRVLNVAARALPFDAAGSTQS